MSNQTESLLVEDILPMITPSIEQIISPQNEVYKELAQDPVALIILMIFLGLAFG